MCMTGKRGYPNGAEAHREARKLRRSNRATRTLTPYRCPHCSLYHLANGKGGERPNSQRAQKRRLYREQHIID